MLANCLDELLHIIDLSCGCVPVGVSGFMLNQFIEGMLKQETWCKAFDTIDICSMWFKEFCSQSRLAGGRWAVYKDALR